MPKLTLIASFPLGTYYGHRSDGSVETYPTPARLHSALLSAAAQGPHSEAGSPSDAALYALRWLEKHPPTGLFHPETADLDPSGQRRSFRDVGTFVKDNKTKVVHKKIEDRPISDGVAVAAPFGFIWNDVPDEVRETLVMLAEDVPYLGESHSVSVITAGEIEPNLLLAPTANCFTPEAHSRLVPTEGRTDTLIEAYNKQYGKKSVSKSQYKFTQTQAPLSETPTQNCIAEAWYEPAQLPTSTDSPWSIAYIFSLSTAVEKRDRVALCTRMHKAIISLLGFGAAPVITGKYNQGVQQPANRLAIQYLAPKLSQILGLRGPHLALFVPTGTSPSELAQIRKAVEISQIWSKQIGRIGISFTGSTRSASHFWPAPKPGCLRLWETAMPIIPETRIIKNGSRKWTLGDSALLSAGFVWRDRFPTEGSRQNRYRWLHDQVERQGMQVLATHAVTRNVRRYAHHTHADVPLQPYNAVIDLGALTNPRAAVMLGQSRHLGSGLLKPIDIDPKSIGSIGEILGGVK
ncbi:type I-G CRISPR-associated protein Csb2 [Corynebacterium pyruviciproducens]|uniref:type I-G CRISPR-associated protein Csb2 n=1 Tax=Corynebacterium pyruviciproducens TaxID=598660 RepID=UPI0023F1665A|nr:type I-U CRISPR-associated protein Csb2 [Corynebacterium pyruviciproducens]